MLLTLEPNPDQIKAEKLYQQMGLSDEEFAMVENILRTYAELYGNGLVFRHVVRALQLQKFEADS